MMHGTMSLTFIQYSRSYASYLEAVFSNSNLRTPSTMETGPTYYGRRWNHQNFCDNHKSSKDSILVLLNPQIVNIIQNSSYLLFV